MYSHFKLWKKKKERNSIGSEVFFSEVNCSVVPEFCGRDIVLDSSGDNFPELYRIFCNQVLVDSRIELQNILEICNDSW